jgi:CspA family cold shock protein
MPKGTVKWFNNAKGFGFILPQDGSNDIFAHYSAISMEGYKTLKAGQEVTFEVSEGDKGLHATNIVPGDKPQSGGNQGDGNVRSEVVAAGDDQPVNASQSDPSIAR